MPLFKIQHITKYSYPAPVTNSANQIMLFPIADALQSVARHELKISERPLVEEFTDYFGNRIGVFTILKPHTELVISSSFDVTTVPIALPNEVMSAATQWNHLRSVRRTPPLLDLLPFPQTAATAEIREAAQRIAPVSLTPFACVKALSVYIHSSFSYTQGITSVETGIDDVWQMKAGVCQDFANILLVMLRSLGIPSRYVSGYICPKNHDLRGEGATHAWVEAYLPYYGWIGVDPTNNCIVSDRHVRLAVGRQFSDCTPVKGTYVGPGDHTLEVSVTIDGASARPDPASLETMPAFSYSVRRTEPQSNSYRRAQEMQQQQ